MNSQKGAAPLLILVAIIGLVAFLAISTSAPFKNNLLSSLFPKEESHAATFDSSTKTFSETFDGQPTAPQPFTNLAQNNWDIAIHSRNPDTWDMLAPMKSHHGADCAPPLDANNNLVTHPFDGNYDQAVFNCKDHIMTSINGVGRSIHDGYALIYLTPNALVDFSQGEATIKFDMTTLYQGRDWVDIWITPYDDNLQLPFSVGDVDLQDWPKNAVQLMMINANGQGMGFIPNLFRNLQEVDLGERGWTIGAYDQWLTISPQRRDTFEIKISQTGVQMCMPTYNKCFFNKNVFPAPLTWSKGIVQIGHHSYTPDKDHQYAPEPCKSDTSFCADTWHWDNVSISPATPFTMIKANKRFVTDTDNTVTFNQPAPTNAKLRFSGNGKIELSYNNGTTWQVASAQPAAKMPNGGSPTNGHMASYFVTIPAGTQQVKFRFITTSGDAGPFRAKDFAIWSLDTPSTSPAPSKTPSPAPSVSPLPSASAKPGDIDGNNKVDIFDYNILLTNFGKTGTNIPGDFDKNGKVDIFDFNVLLTNFGK